MLLSSRTPVPLRIAALVGLVHASFSAYWALGGSWLLQTVGQRAVDLQVKSPFLAGAALLGVAAVKTTLALVPVAERFANRLQRKSWRFPLWLAAVGLFVYGTVYSVTGILVVTGLIDPAGRYDRAGMIGHAFIWDPLFALWGLMLGIGLLGPRRTQASQDAARR